MAKRARISGVRDAIRELQKHWEAEVQVLVDRMNRDQQERDRRLQELQIHQEREMQERERTLQQRLREIQTRWERENDRVKEATTVQVPSLQISETKIQKFETSEKEEQKSVNDVLTKIVAAPSAVDVETVEAMKEHGMETRSTEEAWRSSESVSPPPPAVTIALPPPSISLELKPLPCKEVPFDETRLSVETVVQDDAPVLAPPELMLHKEEGPLFSGGCVQV